MTVQIFDALKRALRAKGVTYRDLAERLHVSEPTVKRIFQEKDCKIGRLVEICDAIGVELDSIMGSIRATPAPGGRIPPEAEWRLAENPSLLFVLVMLAEKFSPEGILAAHGISRASLFLYLRDLERLGLVALGQGLNARLTVETPIQWNFEGPLKPHFQRVNQAFIGWVIDRMHRQDEQPAFASFSRRMRPETARQLEAEAAALIERVKTLAWHDQHTTPESELVGFKWALAIGQSPFADIMRIRPHPAEAGVTREPAPV